MAIHQESADKDNRRERVPAGVDVVAYAGHAAGVSEEAIAAEPAKPSIAPLAGLALAPTIQLVELSFAQPKPIDIAPDFTAQSKPAKSRSSRMPFAA